MSWYQAVVDIRKGERGKTAGMFLYFFIIVACYWFLKPLRSTLTLDKLGADSIRQLKVVSAFASAGVVIAYSLALTRFSRIRLTYLILGAFVWTMVFFWYFFTYHGYDRTVYYCFYIFLDLFITVNVALFWTFLADIVDPDEASRLYGLIGAGGVIGGLLGSLTSYSVAAKTKPEWMILYVAIVYSSIFVIITLVQRRVSRDKPEGTQTIAQSGRTKLHDALEGARVVFSSSYFLAICGMVAGYEVISTINDFTFHKAVELVLPEDAHRGFFNGFFLVLNLLAVGIQLLLTSAIIRRLGMSAALLLLPLVVLGLSVGFLAFPVFLLMEVLYLSDNALNYSLNQTSREMLFVPVERQDKYRALAFIDMFVQRSAKAVGGFLLLLLPGIALGETVEELRHVTVITIPLAVLFVGLAVFLGRRYARYTQDGK